MDRCLDKLKLRGQECKFVSGTFRRVELMPDRPCTTEYGGVPREQVAQCLQSQ
jgi:hypothetical protein